jgi:hypothetical protein
MGGSNLSKHLKKSFSTSKGVSLFSSTASSLRALEAELDLDDKGSLAVCEREDGRADSACIWLEAAEEFIFLSGAALVALRADPGSTEDRSSSPRSNVVVPAAPDSALRSQTGPRFSERSCCLPL